MGDTRAKHKVQQMIRYLVDGTAISPRDSPRSPDLSHSDEILQDKYDELNRLIYSHIADKKAIGHLYTSYDLEFKKADDRTNEKENLKSKQRLKDAATKFTEIVDNGIHIKIWEMSSDSDTEENDNEDEIKQEDIYYDDGKCEYRDDVSEQTCNSTLTIQEVNSDGEDIESGIDNGIIGTSFKSKHVSFAEEKERELGNKHKDDSNSLESLMLREILRNPRKTPIYQNVGTSSQNSEKAYGYSHCRYRRRSRKGSSCKNMSTKDTTEGTHVSPRGKTKCALDNKLGPTSDPEVKRWMRDKNKLARRSMKEERRKDREQMEKEQNEMNKKAVRLIESGEKVTKWMQDKKKEVTLQRKLQQRVDDIHRRNAALEKKSAENEISRKNQTKEQFEIRKANIKKRHRRLRKHDDEEVKTKQNLKNENIFLEPSAARLIVEEKRQAKAAKKKLGVSVRGTLNRAAKQLIEDETTEQTESKSCISQGKSSKQNKNTSSKSGNKINRKRDVKKSVKMSVTCARVTSEIDPIDQTANRITYNTWVKIKRDEENEKKEDEKSKKKIDLDLEQLLPTLSQERIKRATESKKNTDTNARKTLSNSSSANEHLPNKYNWKQTNADVLLETRKMATPCRPQSGTACQRQMNRQPNRRPSSARPLQRQSNANSITITSSSSSRMKHDIDGVHGERPETQGCEIPDISSCQVKPIHYVRDDPTADDIFIEKHSRLQTDTLSPEVGITDGRHVGVFLTS